VQALPSLQAVPSTFAGFVHTPVAGLQMPATWHWSDGAQMTGAPTWHCPAPSQVSAPLQALPSLQLVPVGLDVWTQAPVEQESVVHGLPSSQDG